MYWIKRKVFQIKNLIKWFPIIWNQYDFDYRFALDVFSFQLEKIANFLDSDEAYSTSAKSSASSIRRFLKLYKYTNDEEFVSKAYEDFEKSYGKIVWIFTPYKDDPKLNEVNINGYTEEQLKDIHNQMIKKGYEKQKKAEALIWKLITNHIKYWWD